MRWVDVIVTVARCHEQALMSWSVGTPVFTCYDGVETPQCDCLTVARIREQLVPPSGILVGSAGRLEAQKGYEYFLRAAKFVVERWGHSRPLRFAIAGDGPLRIRLEKLIGDFGLQQHVVLYGFLPDVGNFLKALDLFVCSSLWEGGPLTVIESALLGVPVVATTVGLVPELLTGDAPWPLVQPGNPQALADAILAALHWRLHGESVEKTRQLERLRRAAASLSDPVGSARRLDDIFQRALGVEPGA